MANVTTFATLKSELLAALGRAPADPVYQMVTRDINRDLRLKVMEKTVTVLEASEINLAPTITGATQANPCVITATAHGLATGTQVTITDVVGMTELNGNNYTITNVSANTFSLDGTDSSGYTAYTSGGIAAVYPRFLEIHSIYRDTDPRYALRPTSPQGIHRTYDSSGTPTEYAILGNGITTRILLNPAPSGSEDVVIRYYGALDIMSADADTNDILSTYPDVFIYGSLYHHGQFIGDPRTQVWQAAYMDAKRAARASDAADRYGGAPLEPVVVTAP